MKKRFIYISLFFLLISCLNQTESWIVERNAIISFGDEKVEKFKIHYNKSQDTLYFKYINQIDTTRVFEIYKAHNSNKLNWSNNIFIAENKESFRHKKLNNKEFKFYIQEEKSSHTTSLLFNSEYGVLAIYNSYGPTLFIVEENDKDLNQSLWSFIKNK